MANTKVPSDDESDYKFVLHGSVISAENIEFKDFRFGEPKLREQIPYKNRRSPIMIEFASEESTTVDMQRLIEVGMNITKFPMASSTTADKIDMLSKLDNAAEFHAKKIGVPSYPISSCVTLKTWFIKCGIIENADFLDIKEGSEMIVTCAKDNLNKCSKELLFLDYPKLGIDFYVGIDITIGEMEVHLYCTQIISPSEIKCTVAKGGRITSLQNVYVRNLKRSIPFLSESDNKIMKFTREHEIDMLIVYYVEDAEHIKQVKDFFKSDPIRPIVIAAICSTKAFGNFDEILKASDGILLPRSVLIYELDRSWVGKLPRIQKWTAAKCQQVGKPMFLAGGIFHQVVTTGEFSDIEISDVSNAILDGVTGFILKECNILHNVVLAILGINDICCEMEPLSFQRCTFWRLLEETKLPVNASEAALMGAVLSANQTQSRVLILPTVSGLTAQLLLGLRPACIVIAVSSRPRIAKMLYTCRNIFPLIYKGREKKSYIKTLESRVNYAAHFAVAKCWLKPDDTYVAFYRSSDWIPYSNMVRVLTVDFSEKILVECEYDENFNLIELNKRRSCFKEYEDVKIIDRITELQKKANSLARMTSTLQEMSRAIEKEIEEKVEKYNV